MSKFVVIDGLDGCGKATQAELLRAELEKRGKKVVKISFPKYESDSSASVRMYLGGELGNDPELLNPYMCGSFYAVDRFIQYVTDWKKYFDEDDDTIIIADRYLSANIIHQGSKIKDRAERYKYIKWCYDYECGLCGLPKEDLTIILTVEPEVSQELMTKRYNGNEEKKDIHEADINYLNNCYNTLNETIDIIKHNNIADWVHIYCTEWSPDFKSCNIQSKEYVHEKIMYYVNKLIN